MKTLKDIHEEGKRNRGKARKLIGKVTDDICYDPEVKQRAKDVLENAYISFLTSHTIALIENEIERLEKGYNTAIEDHITYLKEQLKAIKNK